MIIIESKRKKPATILKKYPNAILADVTSGAKDGLGNDCGGLDHGGVCVSGSLYEQPETGSLGGVPA